MFYCSEIEFMVDLTLTKEGAGALLVLFTPMDLSQRIFVRRLYFVFKKKKEIDKSTMTLAKCLFRQQSSRP